MFVLNRLDCLVAWMLGHWRMMIIAIVIMVGVLMIIGAFQSTPAPTPEIINPEMLIGIDHLLPDQAMNRVSPQIMPAQVYAWAYDLKGSSGEEVVVFGTPAVLWMNDVTTHSLATAGEFAITWHAMSGLGMWVNAKSGWDVVIVWHPQPDALHWLAGLRAFLMSHG